MKKVFMIALCLAVAGLYGCSKGSQEVSASEWRFKKHINEEVTQQDEKIEAGVGIDVPLYKSGKLIVDQENKLNLNGGAIDAGDFSTYTVFKPQMDEGILQTAWKKITGLFKKGG